MQASAIRGRCVESTASAISLLFAMAREEGRAARAPVVGAVV